MKPPSGDFSATGVCSVVGKDLTPRNHILSHARIHRILTAASLGSVGSSSANSLPRISDALDAGGPLSFILLYSRCSASLAKFTTTSGSCNQIHLVHSFLGWSISPSLRESIR